MRPAIIPHAKHYLVSPGRCTAALRCLNHLRYFFEEVVHASGAGTARNQEVSLSNVIDISENVATMQDVQAWLRTRFAGKARKSSFAGLSLHSVGAEFRQDTGSILSCKKLGFKKSSALFRCFPDVVRVDTSESTARLYGVHKSMEPSVLSCFTTQPEVQVSSFIGNVWFGGWKKLTLQSRKRFYVKLFFCKIIVAQNFVKWAGRTWNWGGCFAPTQASTPTKKQKKKGDIPSDTRSIGVWWDIENCAVPKSSIDTIGNSIRKTLHNLQLHGRVIIRAFGTKVSQKTVSKLAKTDVVLKYVPGGENTF